jgi:tight adherence protein C
MIYLAAAVGAGVAGLGAGAYAGAGTAWRRVEARAAQQGALRSETCATDVELSGWLYGAALRVGLGVGLGVLVAALGWSTTPLAVVAAPFGGLLGWVFVRRSLRQGAKAARSALREAAVSLGELVSVGLAGGAGLMFALPEGAKQLSGPAGLRVGRLVLDAERPWEALVELGEQAGASELVDLGQVLALGAEEQSRTKEVLLGWAVAAREAALSDAEAAAGDQTDAMTVSTALVLMGFLLFLLVPAGLSILGNVRGHL